MKKYLPKNVKQGTTHDLRFIRFLIVGASGIVINNLFLVFFTELWGIHYLISAVMATQFSTLWNFVFTEAWVFGDRNSRSRWGRMLRFFLMNNGALLLRGPLLSIFVTSLGIHYLISNLGTLFLIAVIRFLLSDRWIWTAPLDESGEAEYSYDIHNIIGIESWIRLPELEFFLVPELARDPDIRLRLERRKKSRSSDQTITYKEGLGPLGFECSIDLGECTNIQVSPLVRSSPHVLYTNIFEPVLRWNFVRKGYALIHAACISIENQTVMVTARTDTGKTSTILRLIENQKCEFISDDMTILGTDGTVLNFPKPLTISVHTLSALRRSQLTFKERIALQFQSRIHSRSGRRFALLLTRLRLPVASINAIVQIMVPPPKYMINRLIPEVIIKKSASLDHIFHIERGNELQVELNQEEVVDLLLQNAEDAYGFPPYPQLANSLSQWLGDELHPVERGIVSDGVSHCQSRSLRNPAYGWWRHLIILLDEKVEESFALNE